jgi:hypothetical protein
MNTKRFKMGLVNILQASLRKLCREMEETQGLRKAAPSSQKRSSDHATSDLKLRQLSIKEAAVKKSGFDGQYFKLIDRIDEVSHRNP